MAIHSYKLFKCEQLQLPSWNVATVMAYLTRWLNKLVLITPICLLVPYILKKSLQCNFLRLFLLKLSPTTRNSTLRIRSLASKSLLEQEKNIIFGGRNTGSSNLRYFVKTKSSCDSQRAIFPLMIDAYFERWAFHLLCRQNIKWVTTGVWAIIGDLIVYHMKILLSVAK